MAAGGVDHQPQLDALTRFVRERVRELVADGAVPPDVRLHVHCLPRARDVCEQRREKLIAVLEHLHPVASLEARLRQPHDRRQQCVEVAGILHVQARVGAALGRPEEDGQADHGRDQRHEADERDVDVVRAMLAVHQPRLQNSSATTG